MKKRKRIYYTPEQKAVIWNGYKQGDSLPVLATTRSDSVADLS
ncbi:hypothetical protein [Xenorhabdus bovienii]|uniref:Transposase n=1 Tax=Xenorhabdus bovienii str. Intermedium TaxID=1379677 RepID=A0A077QNB5_XENBV|nr:hypothetical protein [Xenorhabdus bovienii]CDH34808.1 hypothetical protein XBI1_560011 [Xenorhabdus bovienii str. Intermedium]